MVARRARASVSDTPVVTGAAGAAGAAGFVVVVTGVVNRSARWQAWRTARAELRRPCHIYESEMSLE